MSEKDSAAALERTIERYNQTWNDHDLDAIMSMHAADMRRGAIVAEPSGQRIEWKGVDVMPFEDGLLKRKTVYSDSVSILRQVGLLR